MTDLATRPVSIPRSKVDTYTAYAALEMSDEELEQLLDARLAEYEANPSIGEGLEIFMANVREQLA